MMLKMIIWGNEYFVEEIEHGSFSPISLLYFINGEKKRFCSLNLLPTSLWSSIISFFEKRLLERGARSKSYETLNTLIFKLVFKGKTLKLPQNCFPDFRLLFHMVFVELHFFDETRLQRKY